MKKFLALVFAVVFGFAGVQKVSAAELYGWLNTMTNGEIWLHICYDDNRASHNGSTTWWEDFNSSAKNITAIIIHESVAKAKPTSGDNFFKGFYKAEYIQGLSNLNTSEMVSMNNMFYYCAALTSLAIYSFNTEKVQSMSYMFRDCWALETLQLPQSFGSDKNTTDMCGLFYACRSLKEIKGNIWFNTSSVTDMSYMFYGCKSWDMSSFASDLDTRNVTNMDHMFWNCKALKSLNLKNWDMSKVTKTYCMFQNCSNLTTIYRNDDWSKMNITSGGSMFSDCTSLKGGKGTSYNSSKTGLNMAHPDNDGVGGYFTGEMDSWDKLYGTVIGTTFNIRYDKECTIRGGLTNITDLSYDEAEQITTVKIESAVKNANITSTYMWFSAMPNLTTVEGLENINWSKVTNVSYMFADDVKLPSIDLRKMNLTGKKCDYMFQNCSALKTIYCDDDYTSTLSSSTQMFYGCSSLQGQRDTKYSSSHTDASYARPDGGTIAPGYFTGKLKELYSRCSSDTTVLILYYDDKCDISGGDIYWNTKNAGKYRDKVLIVMFDASMDNYHPTSIARWFSDYTVLTEISGMKNLHTDQVTDMTETFANCYALEKLDVTNFQTSKVKSMDAMFMGCKALRNINVNNFFDFSDEAVNAIETTTRMFAFCDKLRTIYCNNDWTTLGIPKSANMFLDSKLLVGGSRSKYDAEHVDISYARPEQSASIKGYFTKVRTAVDNVAAEKVSGTKVLRNGVLLIQRGEKLYTITGQEVK